MRKARHHGRARVSSLAVIDDKRGAAVGVDYKKGAFWLAVSIGVGVTTAVFLIFSWWFLASTGGAEFVSRVVVVASAPVAVGAILQLCSHYAEGLRFYDLLGKSFVAAGAALTCLASVMAAFAGLL